MGIQHPGAYQIHLRTFSLLTHQRVPAPLRQIGRISVRRQPNRRLRLHGPLQTEPEEELQRPERGGLLGRRLHQPGRAVGRQRRQRRVRLFLGLEDVQDVA